MTAQIQGRRVQKAEDFGRVAVLLGGWAAERKVSLESGAGVLAALQRLAVDAVEVDASKEKLLNLRNEGFDRAFNILHGIGGEDGTAQAILDASEIPYTGSAVLGSALGMDKYRSKLLWRAHGIPTPDFRVLTADSDMSAVAAALELPIFVKPASEGSSIGMSRVDRAEDLQAAYELAAQYDSLVIAERFVEGGEYTAAILQGESLPLVRIEVAGEFYDFHAKYESDDTRYFCPCGLPEHEEHAFQELARKAFDVLGASGWGRVDFLLDQQGQPWFLELNTVPGMTSHSLVPMAAKEAGLSYDELVWRVLETSMSAEGVSHAAS